MTAERVEISLPVCPWYRDHFFGDRTILPAVETMHLLSVAARKHVPQLDVTIISDARFQRFVEIPPDAASMQLFVEISELNNDLQVSLLTRQQRKAMSRMVTHSVMLFNKGQENDQPLTAPAEMEPICKTVSGEQIYAELVPFGPAYRTLHGILELGETTAQGTLIAADYPFSCRELGSPFPLDGAMHAACVHGQQVVDFVPFPVYFLRRHVRKPTAPACSYRTSAQLIHQTMDELVYNLWIYDSDGEVYEEITALRMRDVTGGNIKPPSWIKSKKNI